MGPRETDIHPPKVKEAGDDLQAAAKHARKRLHHALDSSDTVNSDHTGWTSATQLAACAAAWENHVVELVGEMERLGQDLHDTGGAFTDDDAFAGNLLLGIDEFGEA